MGHYRPVPFHASVALGLTASLTIALWVWLSQGWTWTIWLLLWLAVINVLTALYYGYDKLQARRGGRRIPEKVLHLLALCGGSLGAFAGMQFFRHKTVKGSFRLVFWSIIVLQTGLLAWLMYRRYAS
ncbi:MAG: DUF1294 domain-containing protein [Gemmataceae bacterium]